MNLSLTKIVTQEVKSWINSSETKEQNEEANMLLLYSNANFFDDTKYETTKTWF